jgi:hypothetical protein
MLNDGERVPNRAAAGPECLEVIGPITHTDPSQERGILVFAEAILFKRADPPHLAFEQVVELRSDELRSAFRRGD